MEAADVMLQILYDINPVVNELQSVEVKAPLLWLDGTGSPEHRALRQNVNMKKHRMGSKLSKA